MAPHSVWISGRRKKVFFALQFFFLSLLVMPAISWAMETKKQKKNWCDTIAKKRGEKETFHIRKVAKWDNVCIIRWKQIMWGTATDIRVYMGLSRFLFEVLDNWTHLIYLSGRDYPLFDVETVRKEIAIEGDKSWMGPKECRTHETFERRLRNESDTLLDRCSGILFSVGSLSPSPFNFNLYTGGGKVFNPQNEIRASCEALLFVAPLPPIRALIVSCLLYGQLTFFLYGPQKKFFCDVPEKLKNTARGVCSSSYQKKSFPTWHYPSFRLHTSGYPCSQSQNDEKSYLSSKKRKNWWWKWKENPESKFCKSRGLVSGGIFARKTIEYLLHNTEAKKGYAFFRSAYISSVEHYLSALFFSSGGYTFLHKTLGSRAFFL